LGLLRERHHYYELSGATVRSGGRCSIEADVSELFDVVWLGGAGRFESSRAINGYFCSEADHVVIATGEKFPDALSGSAPAPRLDAPVDAELERTPLCRTGVDPLLLVEFSSSRWA
jgi:hypothetical protein